MSAPTSAIQMRRFDEAMTLKIRRAGRKLYVAESFDPSGKLEWQIDCPMTAQQLMEELVDKRGYHQKDAFDQLSIADSAFSIGENVRKEVEEVLDRQSSAHSDPAMKHLLRQLRGWLKSSR
jgi:hypothetical protein